MTPNEAASLDQLEDRLRELRGQQPGHELVDILNDVGGHSNVGAVLPFLASFSR